MFNNSFKLLVKLLLILIVYLMKFIEKQWKFTIREDKFMITHFSFPIILENKIANEENSSTQ